MEQGHTNSNWNTYSSQYTLLYLLLRPNNVCSFIFIPLITLIMVNIAPSALSFLKNVLIPDKNVLTLRIGIGLVSLLVLYLKDTHFLRYTQEALCFLLLLSGKTQKSIKILPEAL